MIGKHLSGEQRFCIRTAYGTEELLRVEAFNMVPDSVIYHLLKKKGEFWNFSGLIGAGPAASSWGNLGSDRDLFRRNFTI